MLHPHLSSRQYSLHADDCAIWTSGYSSHVRMFALQFQSPFRPGLVALVCRQLYLKQFSYVSQFRLLGLLFDSHLSWHPHCMSVSEGEMCLGSSPSQHSVPVLILLLYVAFISRYPFQASLRLSFVPRRCSDYTRSAGYSSFGVSCSPYASVAASHSHSTTVGFPQFLAIRSVTLSPAKIVLTFIPISVFLFPSLSAFSTSYYNLVSCFATFFRYLSLFVALFYLQFYVLYIT